MTSSSSNISYLCGCETTSACIAFSVMGELLKAAAWLLWGRKRRRRTQTANMLDTTESEGADSNDNVIRALWIATECMSFEDIYQLSLTCRRLRNVALSSAGVLQAWHDGDVRTMHRIACKEKITPLSLSYGFFSLGILQRAESLSQMSSADARNRSATSHIPWRVMYD